MKYYLLALVIVVLCSVPAFSQTKKFQIQISISGTSDKEVSTDMESYVSRELRSLGDVETVSQASIKLWITILRTHNKANTITGYAVSYDVTENVLCKDTVFFDLVDSGLHTGAVADLRGIAEDIVTQLDKGYFAAKRK